MPHRSGDHDGAAVEHSHLEGEAAVPAEQFHEHFIADRCRSLAEGHQLLVVNPLDDGIAQYSYCATRLTADG
jgi:hypothetical protein